MTRPRKQPKLVVLTSDQWEEQFKPILNTVSSDRSWDGQMFETFGDDLAYIQKADPARVWTWVENDDDGETSIVEGLHLVNRLGYFVTQIPYDKSKKYQVNVD